MEEMKDIAKFNLKYDGEALKDHAIDIDILCPSLVSLSKLVKESINSEISVKVANTKQNCFELLLYFVSHSAEISPYLRLFSIYLYEFFSLMEKFKGRPIEKKSIKVEDGNTTFVGDVGDNNTIYNVHINSLNIYNSQETQERMTKILAPLKKDGINEIELNGRDGPISFNEADLEEIIKNLLQRRKENQNTKTSKRTLYLPKETLNINTNTKKCLFSLDSPDGKIISVDISGTRIAEDAERGGVKFGDSYTVMLQETAEYAHERSAAEYGEVASMSTPQETEFKTAGKRKTSYKITEVIEFPKK